MQPMYPQATKLSNIVLQSCNSTNELTILPFSAAADISVCPIMCGFLDYIMTSYASGNIKQVSNLSTYPCSAVFHYLRVWNRVSIVAQARGSVVGLSTKIKGKM